MERQKKNKNCEKNGDLGKETLAPTSQQQNENVSRQGFSSEENDTIFFLNVKIQ